VTLEAIRVTFRAAAAVPGGFTLMHTLRLDKTSVVVDAKP